MAAPRRIRRTSSSRPRRWHRLATRSNARQALNSSRIEGEIALIIGRHVRRVTPEEGWAAVSGVTAANDWGVYDLRTVDKGSNLRNKGGDGFTPLGPAVIPADALDPAALRVRTWVNGELVQDDTTADLVFPFGVLVADLSQLITLEPGDVILTGTPAGSSVAVPG